MYSNRTLIGNWLDDTTLEEYKLRQFRKQMKSGGMMLAKYRSMNRNLNAPTELTQASTGIAFDDRVALYAPHVPVPQNPDKKGVLLGGRLDSINIMRSQDLEDGCVLAGLALPDICERNTFVITSPDYCTRTGEGLKYYQPFLLALSSSLKRTRPLYIRYDPDPCPGLSGPYPLYLSGNPVCNCRWRVLPVKKPDVTRFELEGQRVPVNQDIVIKHCGTNLNLGLDPKKCGIGFNGTVCMPIMKNCLDVYKREEFNNIWQIYTPVPDDDQVSQNKSTPT